MHRLLSIVFVSLILAVCAHCQEPVDGLAWVYDRYVVETIADLQASYRQAQVEARASHRGLWADPEPMPPWLWRHAARPR